MSWPLPIARCLGGLLLQCATAVATAAAIACSIGVKAVVIKPLPLLCSALNLRARFLPAVLKLGVRRRRTDVVFESPHALLSRTRLERDAKFENELKRLRIDNRCTVPLELLSSRCCRNKRRAMPVARIISTVRVPRAPLRNTDK